MYSKVWVLLMSPLRKVFFRHKGTKSLSFIMSIALINNTLCTSVSSVPPWFSFFLDFSECTQKTIHKYLHLPPNAAWRFK